jgi:hypothetical protein
MSVYPRSYLFYNYTPDLKDYVRNGVQNYFRNTFIPLDDFLEFSKDLRSTQITTMLTNYNIPVTQQYIEIFYQISIVYIMDRIKKEKLEEQNIVENLKIQYDDKLAKAYFGKYDCTWFPTGLYILPKILTETISNRIIKLVYYLLRDNTNSIRFSLTGKDETFGDMCPQSLYCIYKNIYDSLNEKFILLFEKKKLLITDTKAFSVKLVDPLTEELVFLFTRHVDLSINNNKLHLPSGSIMVLNKEALASTIKINSIENSIVFVFY